jgi:coatomer subunit beta
MASAALEANCTLLLHGDIPTQKESDLQAELENKDDEVKIKALKNIILSTLNGQPFPKLLMSIIKYTLHSEHHLIKKLCLLYWEVVEKRDKKGKLLHEMILVCNAMKNNLTHPNEYIRGSTLRFLCHLKEGDILESGLIPSITANLEHRHSYVRKNAVMCIYTVYENYPDLIPDAPEVIETFLYTETNPSCKRNAFLMLTNCAQERAINYLASIISTIGTQSESFQLLVLDLIRKACRENPLVKSQYIQSIFQLVNSPANSVAFEGANTLVTLSGAPTAVRAAVTSYCQLLTTESDNNVKLIILGRLSALKRRNEKILQEMLMDILRALASPNIDTRRKTLELALELVSPRNVTDVVGLLKKEIQKTTNNPNEEEYRKALVDAMHKCAVKYPEVVQNVVHLLINFLGDENAASALDVIYFVREIVEEYDHLRSGILTKLVENFNEIRAQSVYRVALWILGEYGGDDPAILDLSMMTVRESVGALPLIEMKKDEEPKAEVEEEITKRKGPLGPKILADGTYAMASSHDTHGKKVEKEEVAVNSNLRALLLSGDYFVASSLANCMTKLTLKFAELNGAGSDANEQVSETLLLVASLLRGTNVEKPVDPDSKQRLITCIRVLLEPSKHMGVFMGQCRETFAQMLVLQRAQEEQGADSDKNKVAVLAQSDELISIRQLKQGGSEDMLDDDGDLSRALGSKSAKEMAKLNRVYQLTGFADPVYAEAQLTVMDYDIILDILVVNQTDDIMENLQVELNTSGDLKLTERPVPFTLKPSGTHKLSASIKVTSTESGVIFGNIVYDRAGKGQTVVVLNNIMMDIMDYITPATTSDVHFRTMWAEFEWENKVAINTDITDLNEYLEHIVRITNMRCLTPEATMSGSCQFLAANFYARSIFGEDALLNLSVELDGADKVTGYIRIRSKTQGIALSLGDKITSRQRSNKKTK